MPVTPAQLKAVQAFITEDVLPLLAPGRALTRREAAMVSKSAGELAQMAAGAGMGNPAKARKMIAEHVLATVKPKTDARTRAALERSLLGVGPGRPKLRAEEGKTFIIAPAGSKQAAIGAIPMDAPFTPMMDKDGNPMVEYTKAGGKGGMGVVGTVTHEGTTYAVKRVDTPDGPKYEGMETTAKGTHPLGFGDSPWAHEKIAKAGEAASRQEDLAGVANFMAELKGAKIPEPGTRSMMNPEPVQQTIGGHLSEADDIGERVQGIAGQTGKTKGKRLAQPLIVPAGEEEALRAQLRGEASREKPITEGTDLGTFGSENLAKELATLPDSTTDSRLNPYRAALGAGADTSADDLLRAVLGTEAAAGKAAFRGKYTTPQPAARPSSLSPDQADLNRILAEQEGLDRANAARKGAITTVRDQPPTVIDRRLPEAINPDEFVPAAVENPAVVAFGEKPAGWTDFRPDIPPVRQPARMQLGNYGSRFTNPDSPEGMAKIRAEAERTVTALRERGGRMPGVPLKPIPTVQQVVAEILARLKDEKLLAVPVAAGLGAAALSSDDLLAQYG